MTGFSRSERKKYEDQKALSLGGKVCICAATFMCFSVIQWKTTVTLKLLKFIWNVPFCSRLSFKACNEKTKEAP